MTLYEAMEKYPDAPVWTVVGGLVFSMTREMAEKQLQRRNMDAIEISLDASYLGNVIWVMDKTK